MKTCITCGMPFEGEHENEIGLEIAEGLVCKYDVADGKMKSPEEIFQGGVGFFMSAVTGTDHALAERLTRKNMKGLAYWKTHPLALLNGPEATDAEFEEAMKKL